MKDKRCDVIIPVYNAYEDLRACIESIFKYTNQSEYNLILIDDKSPDERVEVFFQELRDEAIENLILLKNEENLGFVKTVNKGMLYSKNDVILLNSDTIVTKNWLNKIRDFAYKDETIATVTPLTNNGEICSVPNFCQDNVIPNNIPLEEYAEMIEKISFNNFIEMPTAIGFCMYIKRNVLDEIGLFDDVSFGKGYGEENDFCCRCIEHGYINVICDNTFILHTGSMSFKDDKKALSEKNLKILLDKHPFYSMEVRNFIEKNPLRDMQENIRLNIKLKNNKKNILYLIHNGITGDINNPRGGTEFHLFDIVENLNSYNRFVLIPQGDSILLQVFIDNERLEFRLNKDFIIRESTFHSKQYDEIVRTIISYFKIDIVHIQHLKGHTFDIFNICDELKIPVIMTIHDYFTVCPSVEVISDPEVYYDKEKFREAAAAAVKGSLGYDSEFISIWNQNVKSAFTKVKEIVAPSVSAKKIIENYYDEVNLNIQVIEHGVDKTKDIDKVRSNKADNIFRVAFIGGLAPYKGSGTVHDLIVSNKDKNIQWYIIGNLGDQRLNLLERQDLIKYGRYDRDNIVNILNELDIDLICILSKVPETYAYTLTEALLSEIPVLVTDIGALGERIKKYDAGWIVDVNISSIDLLNKIYEIKNDKIEYDLKKLTIKNLELPSVRNMVEKYTTIYDKYSNKTDIIYSSLNPKQAQLIYEAYNRANIVYELKGSGNENINLELYNKVQELQRQINVMENTLGWKFLNKLRARRNLWIIKIAKKLLYFVVKRGYK